MAIDAYLKIDTGNASLKIEVESFSFGVSDTEAAGDGSVRPIFSDLIITKLLDKNSPALYSAAVSGKAFPSVELVLLPAVQKADAAVQEATLTLSDALVTSVQDTGHSHGGVLADEQIQFDFLKIEIDVDGNKFSFDKTQGKIG